MSSLSPQAVLYRAAEAHNLPVMLSAVAGGADVSAPLPAREQRTPLHAAVLSVSIYLSIFYTECLKMAAIAENHIILACL